MRVPTVRVAHPGDPSSFMTINQADLSPNHDIWPDQAPDYEPAPVIVVRIDPALRDAAAALCLRMLSFKRRTAGEPFDALLSAEQVAIVREMEDELDRAIITYDADLAEREVHEAAEGDQSSFAEHDKLRVTKGPRGRWYVKRGAETVAGPFETEALAEDAATSA